MSLKFFITGTDTNVGKTFVSVGLLKAFKHNYSTIGVKPIASGSFYQKNKLYNQDAVALLTNSSIQLDYQHINPFTFEPPIAPHIAAEQVGISLTAEEVVKKTAYALDYPCDIHVVEGAGGWSVPLNEHETMIDFVTHYKLNIILVVGIRLGCINHAILTYQAMKHTNLPIAGWIANCCDLDVLEMDNNIATLKNWLDIPYLGQVPFNANDEVFLHIADQLLQPI